MKTFVPTLAPVRQICQNTTPAPAQTPVEAFETEYTDTFAGEANYSWCKRSRFIAPATVAEGKLKRMAKASAGLTGTPGKWEALGETLAFRPRGSCTVLFVSHLNN